MEEEVNSRPALRSILDDLESVQPMDGPTGVIFPFTSWTFTSWTFPVIKSMGNPQTIEELFRPTGPEVPEDEEI